MGNFRKFEDPQLILGAPVDPHSPGRTLRSWRSAILGGEEKNEVLSQFLLPEPTTELI